MNGHLVLLLIIACVGIASAERPSAVATLHLGGNGTSVGTIRFVQKPNGVEVFGQIFGLSPGPHGFHIHAYGDLSNGCTSAGGHYNPYGRNHGAPTSADRHVGDLGNIIANDQGIATISILDSQLALVGGTSIIGRAVVAHNGEDDLGLGGFEDSLKTGHAGSRYACGVIGLANMPPASSSRKF